MKRDFGWSDFVLFVLVVACAFGAYVALVWLFAPKPEPPKDIPKLSDVELTQLEIAHIKTILQDLRELKRAEAAWRESLPEMLPRVK